jgi:outer membrane receptor protein involved in Fe transport
MLKHRQRFQLHGGHGLIRRAVMLVVGTMAALAAAAPEPAHADGAPAAPAAAAAPVAAAAAAELDAGPLQEIVVTATRKEEGLSKVPISVTALTQEMIDVRGIKDFLDVARFTPGVNVDNSGTNNIAIRGIASTGGAGTTGIYIDDTPIQMRALAFNPDEALPKSFDVDRIEILRGPQGTLFGAGSEGGTVRYITTQPSLTTDSIYSRDEVSFTQGGQPSYEAGIAAGGPIVDGTFGVRVSAWYRYDGGWIDRIDPYTQQLAQQNANYGQTKLLRIAAVWAPVDNWKITPSFFYQDRYENDVQNYWAIYSNPGSDHYVDANPTQRTVPDIFYLPALKIEGDLGLVKLISNTSYYHRAEVTGYDGTLYNLGFYQTQPTAAETAQGDVAVFPYSTNPANNGFIVPFPLLDGTGLHVPTLANGQNYTAPASINNGQENFTQEVRLQSNDPSSALTWTTGLFFAHDTQSYLEQIHDPLLNQLSLTVTGLPYTNWFTSYLDGSPVLETTSGPFANDSYYLQTHSEDKQIAWFGEGSYGFTDQWKTTVGLRYSKTEFSFNTLTGGPQLFLPPQANQGDKKENSFTPKISIDYQYDPRNLFYFTYAKGFRPGGANNPVPDAACGTDFTNFGIANKGAPATYNSDTVDSFEVGAKNNIDNRIKIASSIYYIRWNNIQQTVVPPICQISFITNLGQAVAKGGDIQADIAVTDAFTAELALGYTDGRYTTSSRLSPTETQPIVAAGDAITGQSGQPAPPFTATIGLEYSFKVAEHESFVRVDDEYAGRDRWPSPQQDQSTLQGDPINYVLSSTNFASFRAGTTFGGLQVQAFIDNLTDTHTVTNYEFSINSQVAGTTRLERDFTFRPRTFGLTFIYRK